jgi:transcription-repair coupling factor (superfamily II helicase)
MDMLICGDAGFGKTEIALRAAYRAALSKKQVWIRLSGNTMYTVSEHRLDALQTVILVPTKVLSEQIYSVLTSRMPDIR